MLKRDIQPCFQKKQFLRDISFCFNHRIFLEDRSPKCKALIENYLLRWGDFNIKYSNLFNTDLSLTPPRLIELNDPLLMLTKEFHNIYG